MAKYNPFQQTFALSMFSSGVDGISGTPLELEEKLTQSINDNFSKYTDLIGTWKIAWGPVVFQSIIPLGEDHYADNIMYVAVNDANTYTVAIAGTNSKSIYDWIWEDANVKETVSWEYSPSISGVLISKGTSLGVSHLLDMKTTQGQTLVDFLKQIPNKSEATIIFTGHSLGGALSPTLALALMSPNNQFGLNKSDWSNVYVYPTAGPTPGNSNFADFFSNVFPITPIGLEVWEAWNGLVWNNLDIVPHGWNLDTLPEISTLYAPHIEPSDEVEKFVNDLISFSTSSGTNYTQLKYQQPLSGTFNTNHPDFSGQAFYQHIPAYYDLLGVPEILVPTRKMLEFEEKASKIFGNKLREAQAK